MAWGRMNENGCRHKIISGTVDQSTQALEAVAAFADGRGVVDEMKN
jgi:hypothetical protein